MKRFGKLLLYGLIALLCTQALYGALVFSALHKQFQSPLIQLNGMVCRDIADYMGLLVRVGKKITPKTAGSYIGKYYGHASADNILVADTTGQILYQSDPAYAVTPDLLNLLKKKSQPPEHFTANGYICTCQPVKNGKGNTAGYVLAIADSSRISGMISTSTHDLFLNFLFLSLAQCACFATMLWTYTHIMNRQNACGMFCRLVKKHSSLCLKSCFLISLLLGQIFFFFAVRTPLSDLYQEELIRSGTQLAHQVQWRLARIAGLGMPLEQISGLESWLQQCQSHSPSLGMAVSDNAGNVLHAASATQTLSSQEWSTLSHSHRTILKDIVAQDGSLHGGVAAVMDEASPRQHLRSVQLDTLTMTVVAALFLCEILFLIMSGEGGLKQFSSSPTFMRPVIFSCLFATEMSMAYVPIRIGELGLNLFGLPPDVVSSLPVSCELFMAGAAMLMGGTWSQRSGWKPMLLSGIGLCCAGSAASIISNGPLPFILSRGLCGLGYGFINLAAQVFVIAHSSESSRAGNLAFMFAGLYAGSLCGSTFGGLIADRFGYGAVFPASCVMLLLIACLLHVTLPREQWMAEQTSAQKSTGGLLQFLSDKSMLSLFAFLIIPNALITVSLFQFFVPLSLSKAGVSAASIGRVFLSYCVIVMMAGPFFGRMIDASKNMARPLFWSMALAALSVTALLGIDGIAGTLICMAALAMSTSIVSNGQGAYALSLPAAKNFGKARTMGAYNVAMRIGQVLGPLSMGVMMSVWSTEAALGLLAGFAMASGMLFLALGRTARKKT
ncbi:MAG: MFS transporter [Mailhella sp.]|nr:MFS transporter [Mailhella sp.]